MSGLYKTPGVYVEEIPKFPPSIAAVETAIPAFIGYTEKAEKNGESILGKPTRIESIAEYEQIFGGAPPQDVDVYLDGNNNFVRGEAAARFFLYDSLRLFYANGGGKCYIVSVGDYSADPDKGVIEPGILVLEQEDEPTIILLPDAAGLATAGEMFDLQKTALAQCNKLMDRITVCDLPKSGPKPADFKTVVDDFRGKIGINYLKYGSAYGPWINASLPRLVWHKNMKIFRDGTPPSPLALESLTADTDIIAKIQELQKTESSLRAISNPYPGETPEDVLRKALDDYNTVRSDASPANADLQTELQKLSAITFNLIGMIQEEYAGAAPQDVKDSIDAFLTNNPGWKSAITALVEYHKALSGDIETIDTASPDKFDRTASLVANEASGNDWITAVTAAAITGPLTPATADGYPLAYVDATRDVAQAAALEAIAFYKFVLSNLAALEKTLNESLLSSFGKFKELSVKAGAALNLLPPSGAIAGVYAATDRDRGVWKAPANVSLNAVISPAVKLNQEQQGEYNIDVNAGKSVNIIREFTGKGTLVWGARTLAGNDNEWRYVNVRRFFNFVEESVKKATEQFVFEPNDANTWVRVQAMIENFLNTLWRQGALQGIKPEHAYYVAVGLGKTMTALDILEGRMIIEIGMAAVRPAEFIILKFSHKMAES